MNDAMKQRLGRAAPWVAAGLAAPLFFGLGVWVAGDGEGHPHGAEQVSPPGGHPHGAEQASAPEGTVWTCSMHPQIRKSEPGRCPICGMDLIPVTEGGGSESAPERIALSERAKVLARIRTTPVRRRGVEGAERRLLGRVTYDETRLKTVTSWIGGRIDRLHLSITGERVRRGQTIATLYSPEVYSAHQDLLSAKRQAERLTHGTETARAAASAAIEAARHRLRLLGIPDDEIERMERSERPSDHVAIRSPFAGTVIERIATEGSYVQTGAPLYRVADLTAVWIQLDAYESDLPLLSVGQPVELSVAALPGEPLEGRVAFVDPVVDPRTRTAQVRVEVANEDGRLKPGMFAEAVVRTGRTEDSESETETPLVIPETAPLFTGRRSIVYVEVPGTDRPTYEVRVVRLGPKAGDEYPVIAGLSEGERVVTHGAFALDADLQIRGGNSMMTAPDDTEHGPYDDLVEVPAEFREGLATVMRSYLQVQAALADDDLAAAKRAAAELRQAAERFQPGSPAEAVRHWRRMREALQQHGRHLDGADSLDGAREAFLGLSQQAMHLVHTFGNPLDDDVRVAHCPMAGDGRGADWLQLGEAIHNPYFGREMLTCGEVRHTLEPHAYAPQTLTSRRAAPAGGHQH